MQFRRLCNICLIIFIIVFMGSAPLLAAKAPVKSDDSARALEALYRMRHSMDHITTFQSDVDVLKTFPQNTVTAKYTIKLDRLGHAVVEMKTDPKHIQVKNKKGYFLVIDGKASKQPDVVPFPFTIPTQFLETLNPADVTASHKILVHQETGTEMSVRLIPVDTAGASIEDAMQNPLTMLELTIQKPHYLLTDVKLYRDAGLTRYDNITFRYETVTNNSVIKDPIFGKQQAEKESLALVYQKSVTTIPAAKGREPQTQIAETHYRNVIINEPLPTVLFDEEEY